MVFCCGIRAPTDVVHGVTSVRLAAECCSAHKKRSIPLIIPLPTPYSATVTVAVHMKRPHVAEETGIAARIISSLF